MGSYIARQLVASFFYWFDDKFTRRSLDVINTVRDNNAYLRNQLYVWKEERETQFEDEEFEREIEIEEQKFHM